MNAATSSLNMDPHLAKRLFEHGAVLIIAGVPIGSEFGIDLCSYTIGENFRGVKMIPEGTHFVWCASQGLYGDVAPRVGFVHYFTAGEIVIREWDNKTEELRERQIADPELEKQRIRQHIFDLDKYLAPYDYRFVSPWKHLTDDITPETVQRCRPEKGTIRTNIELQSCPDSERPKGNSKIDSHNTRAKAIDENDLLPQLRPIEGTAPRFVVLPERVPKESRSSEISQHSMDCIAAIDKLMSCFSTSSNGLCEEIQLSFVFFLVGHSLESLTHWRRILHLLAHSESGVGKYKLFFMKYSELLGHQLPNLPEELMESSEHNTVYRDVRSLLQNLHINGLGVSAERLSNKLASTLDWKFQGLLDEDPDELPVVVEDVFK